MTRTAEYDYIIVGTGPAGATLARYLARSGRTVCLLESGRRIARTGFAAVGPLITTEQNTVQPPGGVSIASAKVLGGTSYVSMGNAVEPPRHVLDEWGIDLGTDLEAAKKDLRVCPVPAERMGQGTRRISEAARQLGWEPEPTPKCVDFARCTGCGQCMFGCPVGAKWTAVEFVDDAVAAGAVLQVGSAVKSVLSSDGVACGVLTECNGRRTRISGKRIILSAGALNTPRILDASGVAGAGSGLAVDVMQTTYGYTRDTGMQNEMVMATHLPDLLTKNGFFTAPFMYVPYVVLRDIQGGFPPKMSWFDKARVLTRSRRIRADRLVGIMTKIRDTADGQVLVSGAVSKRLASHDAARLDDAYKVNREILVRAGAEASTIFRGITEGGHPCGTAAIGRVVSRSLETRIANLFVCDASVFPTPPAYPLC